MDSNAAVPPMRIRWGWRASLLSARLARKIAGNGVDAQIGYAIVYNEEGDTYRRACVFCPNGQMCAALGDVLGDRFDADDRLSRPKVTTMYAQALQRAFPELYAHVTPLVSEEQAQQAADAAKTAQAAAAQLQQAAQTAAATEAAQETAAAKALQDSNTAQLAIAIPQ